eukprot:10012440-Alexandrium_andersonii.AAC.1
MCIRDSLRTHDISREPGQPGLSRDVMRSQTCCECKHTSLTRKESSMPRKSAGAVSYTHLTLPTICSV